MQTKGGGFRFAAPSHELRRPRLALISRLEPLTPTLTIGSAPPLSTCPHIMFGLRQVGSSSREEPFRVAKVVSYEQEERC